MKIAIIGGGISGLTAAWYLAPQHTVSLFEANDYIGGHTHTVDVSVASGRYAIDTGFIVCNDRTYPNFLKLMRELRVALNPTGMSFSVSCERSGLEYNGSDLNGLFAQRRNLVNPAFYKLLADIVRFNRLAKAALQGNALGGHALSGDKTLGSFLHTHGFSGRVISHYLAPMTAAIWSTPLGDVARFPLLFFLRFCDNHGLFNLLDRPQWYVISGGSRRYVEAMLPRLSASVLPHTPVRAVTRDDSGVTVFTADGAGERFDEVIFACHSDEALRLLGDASPAERDILGAIPYQQNEVILHTDARLLPRARRAWAAWNYRLAETPSQLPTVTYDMNQLQGLIAPERFCVTLNRSGEIDPQQVLGRYHYAHPQFSRAAITAQARHGEISGQRHTHYCGAYWLYGFHEDGVNSALRVVRQLGATA